MSSPTMEDGNGRHRTCRCHSQRGLVLSAQNAQSGDCHLGLWGTCRSPPTENPQEQSCLNPFARWLPMALSRGDGRRRRRDTPRGRSCSPETAGHPVCAGACQAWNINCFAYATELPAYIQTPGPLGAGGIRILGCCSGACMNSGGGGQTLSLVRGHPPGAAGTDFLTYPQTVVTARLLSGAQQFWSALAPGDRSSLSGLKPVALASWGEALPLPAEARLTTSLHNPWLKAAAAARGVH